MLVVIAGPAGDVVDGGAEVGEVVAAGPDDGHGQRLDLRGQFGADLAEGAVGVGGDEHALALGQEVCQEGGGGVCLAGARRALHQGLGVAVDAFEDATLHVVEGEGRHHLVVEGEDGAGGGDLGDRGEAVGVDQRQQAGRDLLGGVDLGSDVLERLYQAGAVAGA